MKKTFLPLIIFIFGCSESHQTSNTSINELADIYVDRMIATFPEYSYFVDIPLKNHSGHSMPDANTIAYWEAFEDSLYTAIKEIDESIITSKSERITYWILKEDLESSIQMRVCKRNLWSINHMWGFHHSWARIADFQPVGDDSSREQAFARWNKFPTYVDMEIANLESGIEQGYSMPKEIVELVIEQIETLVGYALEDSPYMSPTKRDSTEDFIQSWGILVEDTINPALQKYANYLRNNYLDKARTDVSILSLPNGSECYKAYIRSMTTTNKTGEEIFDQGLKIVNSNIRTIEELGMELYQSNNFGEIIASINADSTLYFNTSEEILSFNQAIMDTAKIKCKDWFDLMPSEEATLKPYLAHESGVGGYERATENKPAYFRLSLKNPERQTFQDTGG